MAPNGSQIRPPVTPAALKRFIAPNLIIRQATLQISLPPDMGARSLAVESA